MTKFLEQTLVEQLNLTEHEVQYRKHLFDFTDEDVGRLVSCRHFIAGRVEELVRQFYIKQVKNPEIAKIIGDAETLRNLHRTFCRYVLELFDGNYDRDYVSGRLHIGKIHRRVGVTPKLYMSSMRRLQSMLDDAIDEWGGTGIADDEIASVKDSLHKILLIDAQFVFDAYIDSFVLDADAAKTEVESYANSLDIEVADQTCRLREISTKDSLTGLYNNQAFYDFLVREIAVAERYELPLSLVYFDLDEFKKVNDSKGHVAGDRLLVDVGSAMFDSVRKIDIPCRYGGDEFCIILPRTDVAGAHSVCRRLIESFRNSTDSGVSFSMGIVQCGPEEFLEMDALIEKADGLMYQAKARSKEGSGFHLASEPALAASPSTEATAAE
jgi:diguanylate cyclase (GGDEF)-like protein